MLDINYNSEMSSVQSMIKVRYCHYSESDNSEISFSVIKISMIIH